MQQLSDSYSIDLAIGEWRRVQSCSMHLQRKYTHFNWHILIIPQNTALQELEE